MQDRAGHPAFARPCEGVQVHKVKQFQVFLYITNNLIKHQSFVHTQLNDQTVLFQANSIQQKSFVCTQLKCQSVAFNS